jgi:hypothetical protein
MYYPNLSTPEIWGEYDNDRIDLQAPGYHIEDTKPLQKRSKKIVVSRGTDWAQAGANIAKICSDGGE